MSRMNAFNMTNPIGDAAGMEHVRLDVLQAAIKNEAPTPAEAKVFAVAAPQPVAAIPAPTPPAASPLITKTIRLPADLVDYIDYIYTKEKRLKKQQAYTDALEAFFRPLMTPKAS